MTRAATTPELSRFVTLDEYFAIDEASEEKHEYYGTRDVLRGRGEIVARPGARRGTR